MLRSRRPEQVIHKTVVAHLKARGAPGLFFCHCPNGGYRSRVEGAIFKALGVRAGVPDLLILHHGRLFALELKTEKGGLSDSQIATISEMDKAGAIVGVAYGLDDALDWLEQNGLLRRDAGRAVA